MRLHWRIIISVLLVMMFTVPAFSHNGMEDIGTTVVQTSRGGAFIATPPDVGAMNGNPAALAFIEIPEWYLDARILAPQVDYSGALGADADAQYYPVPNMGYAGRLHRGLNWGIGMFSIGGMGAVYDNYDLSMMGLPAGTTDGTSTTIQYANITPTVAMMITPNTSVGFAGNFGRVNAKYDFFGDTIGHNVKGMHGYGYAYRAGIYHKMSPATTLGAYWRSKSRLSVGDGIFTPGPFSGAPPGTVLYNADMVGFNFPEEFGIGVGQMITPEWTAYLEWRRLLWDDVMDVVSIIPDGGDPASFAMFWEDQDVYVVGLEYQPNEDEMWRFGFNYAESCVPDSTVTPLFPAITETHLTAGWEKQYDNFKFTAGIIYALNNSQTSSVDNPYNDFFGAGSQYEISHESWQVGVGFTWTLPEKKMEKE